jgi:hypothetical protein
LIIVLVAQIVAVFPDGKILLIFELAASLVLELHEAYTRASRVSLQPATLNIKLTRHHDC